MIEPEFFIIKNRMTKYHCHINDKMITIIQNPGQDNIKIFENLHFIEYSIKEKDGISAMLIHVRGNIHLLLGLTADAFVSLHNPQIIFDPIFNGFEIYIYDGEYYTFCDYEYLVSPNYSIDLSQCIFTDEEGRPHKYNYLEVIAGDGIYRKNIDLINEFEKNNNIKRYRYIDL